MIQIVFIPKHDGLKPKRHLRVMETNMSQRIRNEPALREKILVSGVMVVSPGLGFEDSIDGKKIKNYLTPNPRSGFRLDILHEKCDYSS